MSSAGSVPAQPAPPEIAPETSPVPETTPIPETTPPPAVPAAPDGPTGAEAPTPHPAMPAQPASEPASAPADEAASRSSGDGSASPTKVRIDTPGATIEIEANESLAEVVATALRLFHEAGGWPQVNSRSAGFAQAERRETHPVQPSSMPYGPGSYPIQMP
ncbi:hypothetical protein C6361_31910 [Plantactinospora sp. BC1]|uniref:hypothetical protein n=1 Tax=Plantactinospora sp. BC1 TaxID=2108470 RepID=UPI000D1593E7|nr:hypothetical protein [Plantactinospora sp. BC1]AVT33287.1 hypothetical protein C6361_31910 [Plantactinospora sp. BC1]